MGNAKNKARLIKSSPHIEAAGCKIHQAEADAVKLVATTATDMEGST